MDDLTWPAVFPGILAAIGAALGTQLRITTLERLVRHLYRLADHYWPRHPIDVPEGHHDASPPRP